MTPVVEDIVFTDPEPRHRSQGILAWVSLSSGGFRLDGLTLRKGRRGLVLVWPPPRCSEGGKVHVPMRPRDEASRRAIHAAVVATWRQAGRPAP